VKFAYNVHEEGGYLVRSVMWGNDTKMNPFENLSTTTRIVVKPFDNGRPEIKCRDKPPRSKMVWAMVGGGPLFIGFILGLLTDKTMRNVAANV